MPGLPVSQSLVIEMNSPNQVGFNFSPKKNKSISQSKMIEGIHNNQEKSPSSKVE
jgi:hypothetical protein